MFYVKRVFLLFVIAFAVFSGGTGKEIDDTGEEKMHNTSNITDVSENCFDSNDCHNEGTCDLNLCKCKPGTKGDSCEIITECESGKYKSCKEDNGDCIFFDGKAVCTCPYGTKFNVKVGHCEAFCRIDEDCFGSNRRCNSDKFCECQYGFEGGDCQIVTACKDLERKCRSIFTKCIADRYAPGRATCECKNGYTYDRDANRCVDPFCFPTNPCKGGECVYDNSIGAGYCKCTYTKYYNYKTEKCEELPDNCILRKTPCGEHEVCVNGKCKCKYNLKEGEVCKQKFCQENKCFQNAKCSAINSTCYCEKGKYYYRGTCRDAECPFNEYRRKCDCPQGMERTEYSDECLPIEGETCSQDCGYGLCVKRNGIRTCKCFNFATLRYVLYKDKCILDKNFCPDGKLQDDLLKCECTKMYTQAADGITCRLKNCNDYDAQADCASKGGQCIMDWNYSGYSCQCPNGYIYWNGKCRDVCSTERYSKLCADKDQFCYATPSSNNQSNVMQCGCPPTVEMVNGTCSGNAENVYMIKNIPVLKRRYEMNSGINIALLSTDLLQSMEQSFSSLYFDYGYLLDYKIIDDVVHCSVWISFKQALPYRDLMKVKLLPKTFYRICEKCDVLSDNAAVVWPPYVLLKEKGLEEAMIRQLYFCSDEVKDLLCGKLASCNNNKCYCAEGFKTVQHSTRTIGNYLIQHCEDIDECTTGSANCSKNTNCVNTVGSYKCECKEGYKRRKGSFIKEDDKSECYDMCTPSPCRRGKCSLRGNMFDCHCDFGYSGSLCDRVDLYLIGSEKKTVIVGVVLGFLFIASTGLLMIIIIVNRRKNAKKPNQVQGNAQTEMVERRHIQTVE